MTGDRTVVRWLAGACALLCGVTACTDAAGDSTGTTSGELQAVTVPPLVDQEVADGEQVPALVAEPGMLVWVHNQEPRDLHLDDPKNSADIASWVRQGMLEGLFGVDQSISYYPELLASEPNVTPQDDGTVTIDYQLRSGLTWSDGTPLTADDVAYTHQILTEGCGADTDGSILDNSNDGCVYEMSNRIGYDLVTSFEVTGPTQFTVIFSSFFAGWRNLYDQVFAAHAFGADAAAVNNNLRQWQGEAGTLPSSGPLLFGSWDQGSTLTLPRNDSYHGSTSPDVVNTGPAQVNGVVVAFVGDSEFQIDLLAEGQAHIIMTELDSALERLTQSSSFTVDPALGPEFEHLGMNLLNDHLADPQVREAVAYAVDKSEIVTTLYQPLVGPDLPQAGLGNTYWMTNQPSYQDHQSTYAGNNVEAAATALEAAGYTQGADGIWSHPTNGRLSLRAMTTGGDRLRELTLELIAAQLGRAGIEVIIENPDGGLLFTEGPFADAALEASSTGGTSGDPGLWDLALFGWESGPWPGGMTGVYRSRSASNPYGFVNPEFDVAGTECDAEVADTARATCYNELDAFVTTPDQVDDGLFMVPITQEPVYYGYSSVALEASAVPVGFAAGGPLVNVGDFSLAAS